MASNGMGFNPFDAEAERPFVDPAAAAAAAAAAAGAQGGPVGAGAVDHTGEPFAEILQDLFTCCKENVTANMRKSVWVQTGWVLRGSFDTFVKGRGMLHGHSRLENLAGSHLTLVCL